MQRRVARIIFDVWRLRQPRSTTHMRQQLPPCAAGAACSLHAAAPPPLLPLTALASSSSLTMSACPLAHAMCSAAPHSTQAQTALSCVP